MRRRAIGLLVAVGLFVGGLSIPAGATAGCQANGLAWADFGQSGEAGAWMGAHASIGDPNGFPVDGGPGVIARIVEWEKQNLWCTG